MDKQNGTGMNGGSSMPDTPPTQSSGTTFSKKEWTRKVHYIGKEPGDRYPVKHVYEFTTLDTVRPEHRRAVALLDAVDVEQTGFGMNVTLKDIGEKNVVSDIRTVVYVIS